MRFVKATIQYGDDKPVAGYINIDEAITFEPHSMGRETFIRFSDYCTAVVDLDFEEFVKRVQGVDIGRKPKPNFGRRRSDSNP